MYVVTVHFTIDLTRFDTFMELMHQQADNSIRLEEGCHQFDVVTDPSKPGEVFLYELYTDRAAFDTHLESEHFFRFFNTTEPVVLTKTVFNWTTCYQPK